MFSMMKMEGFQPDVIAYTTMLNAYSVGGRFSCTFHRDMLAACADPYN